MKLTHLLALSLVAGAALPTLPARATPGQDSAWTLAQAGTTAADMTAAEVRKIDKGAGKVTLKHGEIKNLDMPPMTMVFAVKDKAMLDKLQVGDKVRFKAVNDAGMYTVTDIQPVR